MLQSCRFENLGTWPDFDLDGIMVGATRCTLKKAHHKQPNNCRASHTGDACRGRGRERERGISSELADMTCCELHLRCRRRCCCCCFWSSFSFSFLFVLSLSLSLLSSLSSLSSLALLSSSWSSSASSSSLLLLLLYLLLLGPVVVVVVIFVVGTFLQTPQNHQIDGFCKPQKASNRRCFRDFSHSRNKKTP